MAFYGDLLAEQGPLLGEPYTRQLDGKLRELRFHLAHGRLSTV
ncbi:type II toxin-antitoxin system RelE/ParE family toxin [Amycolatopsis sp. WAC 04197]|nr:type II toxin-antitoxin system RelE/ParE family toxin [Amycolatopsis sp. WAC 04197]